MMFWRSPHVSRRADRHLLGDAQLDARSRRDRPGRVGPASFMPRRTRALSDADGAQAGAGGGLGALRTAAAAPKAVAADDHREVLRGQVSSGILTQFQAHSFRPWARSAQAERVRRERPSRGFPSSVQVRHASLIPSRASRQFDHQ